MSTMIIQRGFERSESYRGGCVSIGNFDGVHRGHQRILTELVSRARAAGGPAVVLTFDPHPIALLAPDRVPPSLTTLDRKAELIERCGVDCLIAYPTSPDLLNLSPREFFDRVLRGELQAKCAVEGPNFYFGRDRAGDVELLAAMCRDAGMTLTVASPALSDGRIVSSSAIRGAIAAGRMKEAVEMLGHLHQIAGTVAAGAGRGRHLGFPTANLTGIVTLLPADGVYAGVARLNRQSIPAAVHIGSNPTFGEPQRKVEAHLVGFEGDLYGQPLAIDLIDRVRETRTFDSGDALQAQLRRDVARAIELAASHPGDQNDAAD